MNRIWWNFAVLFPEKFVTARNMENKNDYNI